MPSSIGFKKDINKQQKIEDSKKLAEEFAIDILNGVSSWGRVPVLSDVMRIFSKPKAVWAVMAATLKIETDICTKCGLCVNICPVSSISMDENGFPHNDKTCNSCLRCLTYCPVNAYKFLGKKINQNIVVDINQLNK